MWKPEHRIAADRSGLRYPSDLTGAEWAVVENGYRVVTVLRGSSKTFQQLLAVLD